MSKLRQLLDNSLKTLLSRNKLLPLRRHLWVLSQVLRTRLIALRRAQAQLPYQMQWKLPPHGLDELDINRTGKCVDDALSSRITS